MIINSSLGSSAILLAILFAGPLHAIETNSAAIPPPTLEQLKAVAQNYEKAGNKAQAAETYEQIIKADPTTTSLLAPRLVDLYCDTQQPRKAMPWAREVMKTNPDPQAYLASTYARIGMTRESRAILAAELEKTKDPRRKMLLNWQLADTCEKTGDIEAARAALTAASSAAASAPDAAAARKKLDNFGRKHAVPQP